MATKKGQLRRTSRPAYTGLRKRRRSSSPAFKKLEADKMRLQARYRRLRDKTKDAPGKMGSAICTTTGGALSGAANVYFPAVMGIPSSALVGGALVAYGFFDSSKIGSSAACVGAGMLAAFASQFVQDGLTSGEWNPLEAQL